MFGKKTSPKIVRSTDESFETIIGQSTEIHGQIIATQSLRIDGSVTGDIAGQQCELSDRFNRRGARRYSRAAFDSGRARDW